MRNILTRVIILIILGALIIALPLEIAGLVHNQNIFEKEAEDKIEYAIKSAGIDLDVVFGSMDSLVNMLQATVEATYSGRDYIEDYDEFMRLKKQTGRIIKQTLENTEHISGIYVTFSKKLHSGMEEVWYAYKNNEVQYIDATKQVPPEHWLVKGNKRVDYYYVAIENGDYWGGPYYETTLKENMVTHTKSVHDDEGNLIGIVGADMLLPEVSTILKSIEMYSDSQIVLFDSDMEYCASSNSVDGSGKFYDFLAQKIEESDMKFPAVINITYNKEKYIAAYTTLGNGWVLAATQKAATVMSPESNSRRTLIAVMIMTIMAIIVVTVVFIKRFYGPVMESAEQNEIILINQSRQAKLGEMVGNVAHQCKQPLNSMNIDISNMRDDYYANELTAERFREYEKKMRENVSMMTKTITDFSDFLKPDRNKETFSVKESVDRALAIMKEGLVINEINIANDVGSDVTVTSYRNEFVQCIFNVLENGREAAVASDIKPKTIRIYSEVETRDNVKTVYLHMFNSGEGIPEDARERIFMPYYSTKEKEGGTGIGLYLVKQIIENHFNGKIYFKNSDNGVTFTIELSETIVED